MYNSITDIIETNKREGFYFFSKDTMEFFASKVYPGVYGGKYFITSEKDGPSSSTRAFTIREAKPDGNIDTVGEFCEFKSKAQAEARIKELLLIEAKPVDTYIKELVKIGFCQPKNYKRTVWKYANEMMELAVDMGLAKPYDYGLGKGKYTCDGNISSVADKMVSNDDATQIAVRYVKYLDKNK